MLRVGLTGGIGSGKSTVGRMLEGLGALLLDADQIARRCTEANGGAMPAITERFGSEFVTPEGAMDRDRMREWVFAHPEARLVLESIVHPLVQEEMRRLSQASRSRCQVFDIPLLVESSHWRKSLDRIVVVDCAVETQIRRVKARNGWSEDVIEAIIRQQSSRARRLEAADDVIWNDGVDIPTLSSTVGQLAARLGL
jgi:dephospho-CoA kinase